MNYEAAAQTQVASLRNITVERLDKFVSDIYFQDVNFSSERLYHEREQITGLRAYAAPDRVPFSSLPPSDSEEWKDTEVGRSFGPTWATHWFRLVIPIPAAWAGKEVHLLWDSDSEAMVYTEDGRPQQGLVGGSGGNRRVEYLLDANYTPAGPQVWYIEMACNGLFGAGDNDMIAPPILDKYFPLKMCDIAVFDREAWDFKWDFQVIFDMARALPESSNIGWKTLRIANEITNVTDPLDRTTWPKARELLQEVYESKNGSNQHTVYALGHCHIDSAWLWPYAETRRKAARSWASQLEYMTRYPGFKFVASQAQQYQWVKEDYPELFERIKASIAANDENNGFIFTGGTWVEMDTNMPSGESLVRQFLLAQRFYEREFGRRSQIFWLPDTFGYSGQLPQIVKGAGIDYFLTQKLSWNNINAVNHHTFVWEGIDGSQIMAHFPPSDTYNSNGSVQQVMHSRDNYKDKSVNNESLLLYGNGDGGGGPQMAMIEQLKRQSDIDGLPKVQLCSPNEFFDKLAESKDKMAIWVGELYFELHRGTYTSQAAIKLGNRRSEQLMKSAELFATAALHERQLAYPQSDITTNWEKICLNQFHDVIPGSSIAEVFVDARALYAEVQESGTNILDASLRALFDGVDEKDGKDGEKDAKRAKREENAVVANSLSWERTEVVECPSLPKGNAAQVSHSGNPLVLASAPSLGYRVQPIGAAEEKRDKAATIQIRDGVCVMENEFVVVEFQRNGRITRFFDKREDRNVIEPGSLANNFVIFDDIPLYWDAWDVEIYHLQTKKNIPDAISMEIVESGPVRVALQFRYQISSVSTVEQTVFLTENSARLDFRCVVDWHENRKFLKVEFPVDVRNEEATYECAFGHLKRPTVANTTYDIAKFEVCGHRWADLSEYGYGVALINDSKYGYACHRNVLRLSLLKAAKRPDADADMGLHNINFALFPHPGSLEEGRVIQEAHAFNNPLLVRSSTLADISTKDSTEGDDSFVLVDYNFEIERSYFRVDKPSVIIDAVKKAEDSSSIIVRLYEAYGGRTSVTLGTEFPVASAHLCNLLEDETEELEVSSNSVQVKFTPFQIRTVKLSLAVAMKD